MILTTKKKNPTQMRHPSDSWSIEERYSTSKNFEASGQMENHTEVVIRTEKKWIGEIIKYEHSEM